MGMDGIYLNNRPYFLCNLFNASNMALAEETGISGPRIELEELVHLDFPFLESERWIWFSKFFGRLWFHRLWVVQEVGLAEYPSILCDRYQMD